MDTQAMKKVRWLYRTDAQFRHALRKDPEAALIRWELAGSETARTLVSSLRELLGRSPEEVFESVPIPDLPNWHAVVPRAVPSE